MAWFAPSKVFMSNPGCFLYSYPLNLLIFSLHRHLTARRTTSSATCRSRKGIELRGARFGLHLSYRRTGAIVGFEQKLEKPTPLARGRRDLTRGNPRRRPLRYDLASLRRAASGPHRRGDGRRPHLRPRLRPPRRDL